MTALTKKRMPRCAELLMLILGGAVWSFNTYKIITGLRSMSLLDGLTAGMIFLFGPLLLWESLTALRSAR